MILLNKAYVVIWTFGKPPPPCYVHMVYECPLQRVESVIRYDILDVIDKSVFKIRTLNQLQIARILLFSKRVSNIETSYQIFNFSLFQKNSYKIYIDLAIFDTSLLKRKNWASVR